MNQDQVVVWGIFAAAVIIAVPLLLLASRRHAEIRKRLMALATEWGWQELRHTTLFGGSARGTWNGLPVRLQHRGRYKHNPEKLLLTVKAQSQARLIITRRLGDGFWQRPLVLFGPPLVAPMGPAAGTQQFWIRSDEPMAVETLLGDPAVTPLLERNLICRFDSANMTNSRLLITRAVDDRLVKQHFQQPMFRLNYDYGVMETIAREGWELAGAMARRLNLR